MGQVCGCSAAGERLLSAVRDGDAPEVEAIIGRKPRLAKYATFGVRNTALHYAACKGHTEVLSLLLRSGVDVNKQNYCGQTALMHACRFGHWEAVQILLLHKADATKRDCMNGRTALHYAAAHGQARCVRLVLADLIPQLMRQAMEGEGGKEPKKMGAELEDWAFAQAVNEPAESGITALHMAAVNKHTETVQLLLDMDADVHAFTYFDGATDCIGPGSTPLHYAAAGGSIGCVQALLARGACKKIRNSTGWTPVQVARHWRRPWLDPLLSRQVCTPLPDLLLPTRPGVKPLMAALQLAREHMDSAEPAADGSDACGICLERATAVSCDGCLHKLCTGCALSLCATGPLSFSLANNSPPGERGSVPCPFCRHPTSSFQLLLQIGTSEADKDPCVLEKEVTGTVTGVNERGVVELPSAPAGSVEDVTGVRNEEQEGSGSGLGLDGALSATRDRFSVSRGSSAREASSLPLVRSRSLGMLSEPASRAGAELDALMQQYVLVSARSAGEGSLATSNCTEGCPPKAPSRRLRRAGRSTGAELLQGRSSPAIVFVDGGVEGTAGN